MGTVMRSGGQFLLFQLDVMREPDLARQPEALVKPFT
jgi:hypothetical protein